MRDCPLCRNTHIGNLIFASPGFRTLLVSDWEACCTEQDLDHQLRNQLPLIKPPSNLARFIELVNATNL